MTPTHVVGLDVRRVDDHVEVEPVVDGALLGEAMEPDLTGIWVVDAAVGPFRFDRTAYERTVAQAAAEALALLGP